MQYNSGATGAVLGADITLGGQLLKNHVLLLENGTISGILPRDALENTESGLQIIDGTGLLLSAGLLDLHIHGAMGHTADASPGELETLSTVLPRFGVTRFLPTVVPCADDTGRLRALSAARLPGAQAPAFLLEGHYLALTGILKDIPADFSRKRLEALREAAGSTPLVFAVSPEIEELEDLLPLLAQPYPAFLTHTAATAAQALRFIEKGATHATHLFNVFPYTGDSEPGVRAAGAAEAVLADERTTADLILDGEHVDPLLARLALRCLGPQRLCLATDANSCAGLPPGSYPGMGGIPVVTQRPGGPAREAAADGSVGLLAGSGLTLDAAVRNTVRLLGCTPAQALEMASEAPARALGVYGRMGTLQKGAPADFVLWDQDLNVQMTFVDGRPVYRRASTPEEEFRL